MPITVRGLTPKSLAFIKKDAQRMSVAELLGKIQELTNPASIRSGGMLDAMREHELSERMAAHEYCKILEARLKEAGVVA